MLSCILTDGMTYRKNYCMKYQGTTSTLVKESFKNISLHFIRRVRVGAGINTLEYFAPGFL